jgi:hypothetical protein
MFEPAWWQRGAIYQIYPRSFADSDGNGVGDLRGIRAHLDYLSDLAVEAVWLSPIYPSPMVDFGYDVADYCDVDPIFGSLADLDRLIDDGHARARPSSGLARPGPSTSAPASGTCIPSRPSSRTSIGTTLRSRRPCTTCCASGWPAAWTGSAST